jgi:hypothetical protein
MTKIIISLVALYVLLSTSTAYADNKTSMPMPPSLSSIPSDVKTAGKAVARIGLQAATVGSSAIGAIGAITFSSSQIGCGKGETCRK